MRSEPSSSEGLWGSRPAGSTDMLGRSGNGSTSSSETGVLRVRAVVTPLRPSSSKWAVKLGRRRSSSINTTRRPVNAIAWARSTATVVFPSPLTALVTIRLSRPAADGDEVQRAAQDPIGLELVAAVLRPSGAEGRLGDRREHGKAVLAFELLDRLDTPVERVEQEDQRERQCRAHQQTDGNRGRELRTGGARRRGRQPDDRSASPGDRASLGDALERLFERRAFGRAGGQRCELVLELRLGGFDAGELGLRAEGDVLLGERVGEPRRVDRIARLGDEVEDVRVGCGFDLDEPEERFGAGGQLELTGDRARDFGRIGDQDLGVGFALRFRAHGRGHRQCRARQGPALEGDARARLVGLGCALVVDDGDDDAGEDDAHDQQAVAPEEPRRSQESPALAHATQTLRGGHHDRPLAGRRVREARIVTAGLLSSGQLDPLSVGGPLPLGAPLPPDGTRDGGRVSRVASAPDGESYRARHGRRPQGGSSVCGPPRSRGPGTQHRGPPARGTSDARTVGAARAA